MISYFIYFSILIFLFIIQYNFKILEHCNEFNQQHENEFNKKVKFLKSLKSPIKTFQRIMRQLYEKKKIQREHKNGSSQQHVHSRRYDDGILHIHIHSHT